MESKIVIVVIVIEVMVPHFNAVNINIVLEVITPCSSSIIS